MSDLAHYSQQLALLINHVGEEHFPQQLVHTLRALVPIDDATVLFYPERTYPVVAHFEVPEGSDASTLSQFVLGPFLLDPFYIAGTEQRFGLFRLRELAPTGFKDSEYYKNWYRNCGYQDECGYVVSLGEGAFLNIALGKIDPRSSFSAAQVRVLDDILPVIESLCQHHWDMTSVAETADTVDLRAQLHQALQHFGESLLTDREAQVINLVLHGHSTKTVAERLSISIETVKLHRKHAYAKLEVSSQAELFYLFLDSLMSAKDYAGGDTLVAYMQPPPPT
ncbi:helix-turn-helix transcriptional regulator [Parahaliea mediterranea]|uniref:helix-turn-helix transcriptional regulator n=1 Tax=Parahaliea mediterranea TaxID=651086 RepID=UPI000E2F6570|nr:LuxR family transcriptional regulator [Parahaliea mediterranea]